MLLRRFLIGAILVMIFCYQFLPIIHFMAPIEVSGKNLYTMLPVIAAPVLFICFWPGIKRDTLTPSMVALLAALLATWVIVILSRSAAYGEDEDILFQRFVVIVFIYSALFMHLSRAPSTRELLAGGMIVVAVTQAIAGMVHSYFFPNINIYVDHQNVIQLTFDGNASREFGTLVSASVYAGVLVSGQFVLLGYKRLPFGVKLGLMAFITYAVSLAGSRYPIVMAALLTLALVFRPRMERTAPILIAAATLVVAAIVIVGWEPAEFKGINRFGEDDGGRLEKTMLALDLFISQWQHWLIGAPNYAVAAATTADGITISDNSYALIALQFGLPVLLLWLACAVTIIVRRPVGLMPQLMLLYFFVNLGITNSVLWEPWLFYFCLALWIVRRRTTEPDEQTGFDGQRT